MARQDRISRPLLDRIDMQVQVDALSHEDLLKHAEGAPSHAIAACVERASKFQLQRQGKSNHGLSSAEIDEHCTSDDAGAQLLRAAMARLNWSARSHPRVLKVARTITDLNGASGNSMWPSRSSIGGRCRNPDSRPSPAICVRLR
jgi:magnesium chelatase family protein